MELENEIKSKLGGHEYWKQSLNQARYVVAPMVEQSELPWRLLSRNHGAELCYTPMLHANVFSFDQTYRKESLTSCPEDRPLIVQFCANDPDVLLKACKHVPSSQVDGVDLNLGCPQVIAKRGNYGAFLQDDWDKVRKLVETVHKKFHLPISCKIRVFDDIDKTIRYAKMIEEAGCQILTVHGRTREQKGPQTGLASWEHVAAVKKAVNIPVFANGNVQVFSDIDNCLASTGADGIMIAEGNLHNPALFEGKHLPVWELALEYLDLVDKYPCPTSSVRGHLFKLFHHTLFHFEDIRDSLAKASLLSEFRCIVELIRDKCMDDHEKYLEHPDEFDFHGLLFPHWISQPFYRAPSSSDSKEPAAIREIRIERRKRQHEELNGKVAKTGFSKRKLKKLLKNPDKTFEERQIYIVCTCGNPQGTRCVYKHCRKCCKNKCKTEELNCEGHKFWFANIAERLKLENTSPEVPETKTMPQASVSS